MTALYRDLLRQGYSPEQAARRVDWQLAERIARQRRAREGKDGPPTPHEVAAVYLSM